MTFPDSRQAPLSLDVWPSPTLGKHHWVEFEHNGRVTFIIGILSLFAFKKTYNKRYLLNYLNIL